MIFTERTIKMSNDVCEIDNPIVLYRGDYNVEIRFTIIECPYKYSAKNATNIIEEVDASYGQLVIRVPNNGSPIFSDVVETKRGSIVFTLSGEMIDESIEVGDYTFQIRLFDANRESRATIPPVENGISIREPIAFEDVTTTNEVGEATVGYALTTAGTTEDAFDTHGNYNKTTWATGDRITAAKLNKIEAGIDGVNKKVASGGTGSSGANINDTTASATTTYSSNKIENIKENLNSTINEIKNNVVTNEQIATVIQNMINDGKINISSQAISHPLKGLKWGVIGDSITDDEHQPAGQHYDKVISDITGITSINYGILATTVAIRSDRTDSMLERVPTLQNDLDVITVLGGTNDYGLSIPLGIMGTTDTSTFYGAYDAMVLALIKKYPTKPIGLITPIARGYNTNLNSYRNAIKEIGEKYCVPVLDLYAESGLCCDIPEINTNYFLLGGDKLHPNAEGHKIIARPILDFLNKLCADKIYKSTVSSGGTGGETGGGTGGETGGGTGGETGGGTGGETGDYIMATKDDFTNVLGVDNTITINDGLLTLTNGTSTFAGGYNVFTIDCTEIEFTVPSNFVPSYLPITLYKNDVGLYYSLQYDSSLGLRWNADKSYSPAGTDSFFSSQSMNNLQASKGDTVRLVKTSSGIEGYVNGALKLSLDNAKSLTDIKSNSKLSDTSNSITTTFGFALMSTSTLRDVKYKR